MDGCGEEEQRFFLAGRAGRAKDTFCVSVQSLVIRIYLELAMCVCVYMSKDRKDKSRLGCKKRKSNISSHSPQPAVVALLTCLLWGVGEIGTEICFASIEVLLCFLHAQSLCLLCKWIGMRLHPLVLSDAAIGACLSFIKQHFYPHTSVRVLYIYPSKKHASI
jgi:hypothetical protein